MSVLLLLSSYLTTHLSTKLGCCLLQIQKKKASGKGKKPSVRSSKVATFFDFFSPPVVPDSEDELTQEQMEDLQENLERDYELG